MNWTITDILLCTEGCNRFTVCGFRGWVVNLELIWQKAFRKGGSTFHCSLTIFWCRHTKLVFCSSHTIWPNSRERDSSIQKVRTYIFLISFELSRFPCYVKQKIQRITFRTNKKARRYAISYAEAVFSKCHQQHFGAACAFSLGLL